MIKRISAQTVTASLKRGFDLPKCTTKTAEDSERQIFVVGLPRGSTEGDVAKVLTFLSKEFPGFLCSKWNATTIRMKEKRL